MTDAGVRRLAFSTGAALVLSLLLYGNQTALLMSKVAEMSHGKFETIYPIVALVLVFVFVLLRLPDLCQTLSAEESLASRPVARLVGIFLILTPLSFISYAESSVVLSTVMVAVLWYGVFVALNPSTWKMLLPYASMCVVAALSPGLVESFAGGALADVTSFLTRRILDATGVPILWEGTALEFLSQNGSTIRLTIAPSCSGITYITTFLLLCGLMSLDLRKDASSAMKLAFAGTVALILLNALRLAILIWIGYAAGSEALWSVHNWLGYVIFSGFYAVAAGAYLKGSAPLRVGAIIFGGENGSPA